MPFNIDLKELSARESEQVEWKENGNDKFVVSSIVKTISAFANDIANFGGGYVVCGAKETKELAVMIDTFHPLMLTQQALELENSHYVMSWRNDSEV